MDIGLGFKQTFLPLQQEAFHLKLGSKCFQVLIRVQSPNFWQPLKFVHPCNCNWGWGAVRWMSACPKYSEVLMCSWWKFWAGHIFCSLLEQIFCMFHKYFAYFLIHWNNLNPLAKLQWIAVIAKGNWTKQRLMIQLRNWNLVLSRSVTAVTCRKYSCEWLRRWGKDIWTEGVFSTSGDGIGRSSDERFSGYAEERRWWEVKLIFFNWSNWIVLFFVENLKTEPCEISQC